MSARLCPKSFKLGFSIIWTKNFQIFNLGLEEEKRDQIANIHWIIEKAREFQKNLCFIDYTKVFGGPQQTVGNSSRDGDTKQPYLSPEKSVCRTRTNSKNRTCNNRLVQNWERQGCMLSPCFFHLYTEYIMRKGGLDEAQLESGLLGEISITSDTQMTPPLWQKAKN